MPTKKTKDGRSYRIDGKRFIWTPEQWEGEDPLPDVAIPLRIKLSLVLDSEADQFDADGMANFLEKIIPGQMGTLREMDVNDFQSMFETWQREYNSLTGATLPESSGSAS